MWEKNYTGNIVIDNSTGIRLVQNQILFKEDPKIITNFWTGIDNVASPGDPHYYFIYLEISGGYGPFTLYFGWDLTHTYFWDYTFVITPPLDYDGYWYPAGRTIIYTDDTTNPPNSYLINENHFAFYIGTITDTYNNQTYQSGTNRIYSLVP